MTRVGQGTSGFMTEAAVETEQKLRDQPRQKEGVWTTPPSARQTISLPSDVLARLRFAGTLFGGMCNVHQ